MSSTENFEPARGVTAGRELSIDAPSALVGAQHLQALSARLVSEGDVQSLYQGILDTALVLTQADTASLQVFEPGRGDLR